MIMIIIFIYNTSLAREGLKQKVACLNAIDNDFYLRIMPCVLLNGFPHIHTQHTLDPTCRNTLLQQPLRLR